jgi:glutaredoxin
MSILERSKRKMSWWKVRPEQKDLMIPKKRELQVICPYCEKVIEKVLFKIVYSIDYEYDQDNENEREVRLHCCPHCKKVLGVLEW